MGGLLLTVVVIFLFALFATDLFSPKKIAVPDVANMTVEEAKKELEKQGFIVGEQQERHSEDIEKDKVIETDPAEGTLRVKDTEVDLIVSLGVEKSPMDNYIGQKIDQVQSVLKDKFMGDVRVNYVHSSEEAGSIIDQDPAPNTEIVPKETNVVFTVSQGKKPISVRNVVGYSKTDLDNYVNSEGLKWRVEREDYSPTIAKGLVISQKPAAGTNLVEGDTIAVVLSKGPEEKPVKTFVKTVLIPYEPTEEGMEQLIRIEIQDKNHSMAKPLEEFFINSDREYKIQLVIEEGEEAAYKILRDSAIIAEEKFSYDDVN